MELARREHDGMSNGPVMTAGTLILVGGELVTVPAEIAAAFQPGDRLLAATGAVLHVPAAQAALAEAAVARARAAFQALQAVSDEAISAFYTAFAGRLADDAVWQAIAAANVDDVARASARGRSTTRLAVSEKMRRSMTDGLLAWRAMPSQRGQVVETTRHEGWSVEHVVDGLGVVGFVFEGRPNVFADATGILRGGNTAVMRIGSDALCTARAIAQQALQPALAEAGLPDGCVVLLESAAHAAGYALFAHPGLALAVARGSGPAVAQLGAIARQAGTPVSLHGTGGAWIVADVDAERARFHATVYHSLDRKVCNTANTLCIVRQRAADLVPALLEALEGRAGGSYRLHVTPQARPYLPADLFTRRLTVRRLSGPADEPYAELCEPADLGHEWEWEETPEITLTVVENVDEAITLFNAHSPRFIASLISDDPAAHERFFRAVDAPFVGDGFTRWVDGQYALNRPELGLSNWQNGRLFARGAILSGDGVYTVRYRVRQNDPDLRR